MSAATRLWESRLRSSCRGRPIRSRLTVAAPSRAAALALLRRLTAAWGAAGEHAREALDATTRGRVALVPLERQYAGSYAAADGTWRNWDGTAYARWLV